MTAVRVVEAPGSSPFEPSSVAPPRELGTVELVLGRVRLLARRRLAWIEHSTASGSVSDRGGARVPLEDPDAPEAEQRWALEEPSLIEVRRAIETYTDALEADTDAPLHRLCVLLGLSDAERDMLCVCLASELDPSLGSTFALLQGNSTRTYVTEALVARLMGRPREALLSRADPLVRWEIVEQVDAAAGEPRALKLDPHILDFLCGRYTLDPVLFEFASVVGERAPLPTWPHRLLVERIQRAFSAQVPVRVTIAGPRASGRRTLAACVAAGLGSQAIAIDTSAIPDADWPRVYLRAQRLALLTGTALVWHGELLARRRPELPGLARLEFLITDADFVAPPSPHAADERVVMPGLGIDERAELWRSLVPVSQAWPAEARLGLAERFRLEVGDITAIGRRGVTELGEARELCRLATRDRLGELGQLVECTFAREDLVLPADLDERLDELLFEARERTRFWENAAARRLFPRGTGLVALLTGPPGTGKTMAAQVLAAEIGVDMFRIDLATSISKYIGETSKNLRRIFTRAEEMSAVLLFDEADALFSKRTDVKDAHDRYANTDTNYLLQLLEGFGGIALLSSNKRENIDAAFARRIRYILDFPRPSARERLGIWRRIVRELGGEEPAAELDSTLERVAEVLEMSGAQIKLAMLASRFSAQRAGEPLSLRHLYHGIGRELAKEGRGITPKDRERIERHA
jgi:hypothetical protein